MRTKTLVLAAAISAASLATSMAQVYSVNAVGYVNVTLKKGYNLVANPLNNGGNTLAEVIPATSPLPDDVFVMTWNAGGGLAGVPNGTTPYFVAGEGWDVGDVVIAPGKSFFLYVPTTAPQDTYTITFVGEVPTGTLVTPIVGGARYNALSSQVPQAGKISEDLGLTAQVDDFVMVWDKTLNPPGFNPKVYYFALDDNNVGRWSDLESFVEPTVGVGDGFFLFRAAAGNFSWTRTFNVNTP